MATTDLGSTFHSKFGLPRADKPELRIQNFKTYRHPQERQQKKKTRELGFCDFQTTEFWHREIENKMLKMLKGITSNNKV